MIHTHKELKEALKFATDAHHGVYRKGGNAEYISHPIAVCALVYKHVGMDIPLLKAALLHDVVEDTSYTIADIENIFGKEVAHLVSGVTSPSAFHPVCKLPRKERKMIDARHVKVGCTRIKILKMCDTLHNISDWETCTKRFLKVYIPEKRYAISLIGAASPKIYAELLAIFDKTGY